MYPMTRIQREIGQCNGGQQAAQFITQNEYTKYRYKNLKINSFESIFIKKHNIKDTWKEIKNSFQLLFPRFPPKSKNQYRMKNFYLTALNCNFLKA